MPLVVNEIFLISIYLPSDGEREEVMLQTQSTFALPNRLTQVALYPHMNEYLPDKCASRKLDFFPTYTRDQCLHECAYKKIMSLCGCRPPYLPMYKNLTDCRFQDHAICIAPQFMTFNYTKCDDCPRECQKYAFVRNVEYGKYHEPIYRTLTKFSMTTGSQGIDIAAFQVSSLPYRIAWPITQHSISRVTTFSFL